MGRSQFFGSERCFDDTNWNFSSLANADLMDASFLNADLRFLYWPRISGMRT